MTPAADRRAGDAITVAAAAPLFDQIRAGGRVRLLIGITGPRGSGKSRLLADLAAAYRAAGVETRRGEIATDLIDLPERCAVLVDDAQTLDEEALYRLHVLLDQEGVHLVMAYRPWPHSPVLRQLVDALERHHAPVVLGALSREEVAELAATVLGRPLPPRTAEALTQLTGGMPWLVRRAAVAIDGDPGVEVAPAVIEALSHDLDRMEDDLRELLLALAVGFDLSGESLPPVLLRSGTDHLLDQARAAGLTLPDHTVVPIIGQALLRTAPTHQVRDLQQRLVEARTREGRSLRDVAPGLARHGLKHPRVAQSLEEAGNEALPTQPDLAATLLEQAVAAGGDELATAARRAQAAALTGDLDHAGRILENLLAADQPPDLARAVDVAAAVWAQRGMLARSADTYRWLGTGRLATSAPLAAVTMLGTGDRVGAEEMLRAAAPVAPTLQAAAATFLAEGVRCSLTGPPTQALASLLRASDMSTASGSVEPMPDLPAALAALVAVQSGELDVAESVLADALSTGQGGPGARPRLLLLSAWAAMVRDRPDRARAALAEATGGGTLAPRDEIVRHALQVGLARRTDDVPSLVRAWHSAREAVLHFPVDLFVLPMLGEFVVTAARLRDSNRLEAHLGEAWSLLERLGNPPLWAVPLHWAAVQGAILAERPADLAPHAAALVEAAHGSRMAAAMADAGRAWLAVLSGSFDTTEVLAAARGLARAGLTWDGARLAAHAAARAPERKDMSRLLVCARELRPGRQVDALAGPAGTSGGQAAIGPGGAAAPDSRTPPQGVERPPPAPEGGLSAREREVARLVLEGRTYREIGTMIFISPRTVEHHVARIRRRLGATTRAELLERLRKALDDDEGNYATSA